MTVFEIDSRLALSCVFVSHFICALAAGCTSAVMNVAVTPAAKLFDVILDCNIFEGVAAKYRCAVYFRLVGITCHRCLVGLCSLSQFTNITLNYLYNELY